MDGVDRQQDHMQQHYRIDGVHIAEGDEGDIAREGKGAKPDGIAETEGGQHKQARGVADALCQ
jgi:hypothetical protein